MLPPAFGRHPKLAPFLLSILGGTCRAGQSRAQARVSLNWRACGRAATVRFTWLPATAAVCDRPTYLIYRFNMCFLFLRCFRRERRKPRGFLLPQECFRFQRHQDSALRCQCRPHWGLWDVSSYIFLLTVMLVLITLFSHPQLRTG
jgi:hypothetical protein